MRNFRQLSRASAPHLRAAARPSIPPPPGLAAMTLVDAAAAQGAGACPEKERRKRNEQADLDSQQETVSAPGSQAGSPATSPLSDASFLQQCGLLNIESHRLLLGEPRWDCQQSRSAEPRGRGDLETVDASVHECSGSQLELGVAEGAEPTESDVSFFDFDVLNADVSLVNDEFASNFEMDGGTDENGSWSVMDGIKLLSEEDLFEKGLSEHLSQDLHLDAVTGDEHSHYAHASSSGDGRMKPHLLELSRFRSNSVISTAFSEGNSSRGSNSPYASPLIKRESAELNVNASPKRHRKSRAIGTASPLTRDPAPMYRRPRKEGERDEPSLSALNCLHLSGDDSPSGSPVNSRKNKLQRCSVCGALGHKSRTCQNAAVRNPSRCREESRSAKQPTQERDRPGGLSSRQSLSPHMGRPLEESSQDASSGMPVEARSDPPHGSRIAEEGAAAGGAWGGGTPADDGRSWMMQQWPPSKRVTPGSCLVEKAHEATRVGVPTSEGVAWPARETPAVENFRLPVRPHTATQSFPGAMMMNHSTVPVAMPTVAMPHTGPRAQLQVEAVQPANAPSRSFHPMAHSAQPLQQQPSLLSSAPSIATPHPTMLSSTPMAVSSGVPLSHTQTLPQARPIHPPHAMGEFSHQVHQSQMMRQPWEQRRATPAHPHVAMPGASASLALPSGGGTQPAAAQMPPSTTYMQMTPPAAQPWQLHQWQLVQHAAHSAQQARAAQMIHHQQAQQQQVHQAQAKWAEVKPQSLHSRAGKPAEGAGGAVLAKAVAGGPAVPQRPMMAAPSGGASPTVLANSIAQASGQLNQRPLATVASGAAPAPAPLHSGNGCASLAAWLLEDVHEGGAGEGPAARSSINCGT
ncbi:hypothetical protein AB1Y20_007388 [Prymnesium parvum]|uniref:CCHC-type domain-containing protein n=1 Tax=Prymnesium parvum TaxID=97485 RepID=A0AB34IWZ1_PRYPA